MEKLRIEHGTATYTGGGFYTILGELNNGLYFVGFNDCCYILDIDPRTKAAEAPHEDYEIFEPDDLAIYYGDFLEVHNVEIDTHEKYKIFEDFIKRLDSGEKGIDRGFEDYTNHDFKVYDTIDFSYFEERDN